jgi:hypothetical protein
MTDSQMLVAYLLLVFVGAGSLAIVIKLIAWACRAPKRREEAELRRRQLAELRAKQG